MCWTQGQRGCVWCAAHAQPRVHRQQASLPAGPASLTSNAPPAAFPAPAPGLHLVARAGCAEGHQTGLRMGLPVGRSGALCCCDPSGRPTPRAPACLHCLHGNLSQALSPACLHCLQGKLSQALSPACLHCLQGKLSQALSPACLHCPSAPKRSLRQPQSTRGLLLSMPRRTTTCTA